MIHGVPAVHTSRVYPHKGYLQYLPYTQKWGPPHAVNVELGVSNPYVNDFLDLYKDMSIFRMGLFQGDLQTVRGVY